jgi:amino acid adenylation domain-containing protein
MAERVTGGWYGGRPPVIGRTALDLISDTVASRPEDVAVIDGGRWLTYQQMWHQAITRASALVRYGVAPGDLVGLNVQRGADAIATILAIQLAGGLFLSLDASAPRSRRRSIVADARPVLLITGDGPDLVDIPGVAAVAHSDLIGESGSRLIECRPTPPVPSDGAYVIHTSGSTGRPKGVRVNHGGLVNAAATGARWFGLAPGKRMLQLASWSFDAAIWETFMALTSGATLVVGQLEDLERILCSGDVDAALLTPTVAAWLRSPAAIVVETLGLGGESCSTELVRRLRTVPNLLNCYGPTEASICVAIHKCSLDGQVQSVGSPLPGVRTYVLDAHGNPVGPHEVGELYIGGIAVADGYIDRPDQQGAAFLPDPYLDAGTLMYKTGDRAVVDSDGVLTLDGRLDHQVKIRGVRIELAEVESALLAHPSVFQSGAVVAEGHTGPVLVAAITAGSLLNTEDLLAIRKQSESSLHPAMVPTSIIQVDELPRLPSGKLDRAALSAILGADASALLTDPRSAISPTIWSDPIESRVAELFAHHCATAPTGPADDLLSLGGHSLTAARIAVTLRQEFDASITMASILMNPTVKEVAHQIRHNLALVQPVEANVVVRKSSWPSTTLSFGEQRLWLLWKIDPSNSAYCVPVDLEFTGPVDQSRLADATMSVLQNHPIVNGRYLEGEDGSVHRCNDGAQPFIEYMSIDDADAFQAWHQQSKCEPFDLQSGPLVRAFIIRQTATRSWLALRIHHIVCDGWSSGVLANQIVASYNGAQSDSAPVTYQDFVLWERERLTDQRNVSLARFWRSYLADVPTVLQPSIARTRNGESSARVESVEIDLPPDTVANLVRCAKSHGATLFHVLLTALALHMSRLSGQNDLLIGGIVSDRPLPGLDAVVGFFVNTVPIRAALTHEMTIADAISQVRTSALTALDHADLPFERIVHAAAAPRAADTTPLVQVALNLLNIPGLENTIPGVHTRLQLETAPESKFDLTVYAEPGPAGMKVQFVYRADLFALADMLAFAEQHQSILEQLASPESLKTLADVLLDSAERRALASSSATPLQQIDTPTVLSALRDNAIRHPDRTAIEWTASTTYTELVEYIDACVRAFRSLELDREPRGCLLIEARRTPALAVAVMAALEAAVPYSIIDAGMPPAGRDYIVDTLVPAAILTIGAPVRRAWKGRCVELAEHGAVVSVHEGPSRPSSDLPARIAYVAHTSGTTGPAKLIAASQQPLDRHAAWEIVSQNISANDRVALLSGLSYDPCLRDLMVPLAAGATLCIPRRDLGADGSALAAWIHEAQITVWHTTPGLLRAAADGAVHSIGSLRRILIGGDRLRGIDLEVARERFPSARLINVYGTTETPQVVSSCDVTSGSDYNVVPVGHGTPTSRVFVLDRQERVAGCGELGEVVVQSPYLALGYLHDTGPVAIRGPSAASGEVAGPLYRTGDLGWSDVAGCVYIVGRRDQQLKVGGVRIEPAYIEFLCQSDESVEKAVVCIDTSGTPRLKAYVQFRHGCPKPDELLTHLERYLRGPTLPDIVCVEELCFTRSGKFDQAATRRRALTFDHDGGGFDNPLEASVAAIWERVLGRAVRSAGDDFFRLGGHSLLITRMLAMVRAEYAVDIPFRAFFKSPRLRDLAALIECALNETGFELLLAELESEEAQIHHLGGDQRFTPSDDGGNNP